MYSNREEELTHHVIDLLRFLTGNNYFFNLEEERQVLPACLRVLVSCKSDSSSYLFFMYTHTVRIPYGTVGRGVWAGVGGAFPDGR